MREGIGLTVCFLLGMIVTVLFVIAERLQRILEAVA